MRRLAMAEGWEHFPHGADVGVRGFGPGVAVAFEQAAMALIAVVCDPGAVRLETEVVIECRAPDLELLLYDWLNGLVEQMATGGMLFASFAVEIWNGRLRGLARGEPIDPLRHEPTVEVKGATMTELHVGPDPEQPGAWVAQCVVDV